MRIIKIVFIIGVFFFGSFSAAQAALYSCKMKIGARPAAIAEFSKGRMVYRGYSVKARVSMFGRPQFVPPAGRNKGKFVTLNKIVLGKYCDRKSVIRAIKGK